VVSAARRPRLVLASAAITAVLSVLVLAVACAASPSPSGGAPVKRASTHPATSDPSPSPSPSPTPTAAPLGVAGTFQVGERDLTFTEPAHTGPNGKYVGPRSLLTKIGYPLAPGAGGSQPAAGPLPLVVFGPGFQYCSDTYDDLLSTWVSAGYVVAAVNFPKTDCYAGPSANESDLVNEPADMSFALSSTLKLSTTPNDPFYGLLNPNKVAVAGHSDGGDTVAALAANTCCTDHHLKAVAVLSGAEWGLMPGQYFTQGAPPMLFAQGSADPVNPPSASVQLYRSDVGGIRYYLNLVGADHMVPYTGANTTEKIVARTTLAFFNRYVLGQVSAQATMTQDGNVPGAAQLDSGGHVPPGAGLPA
jgi:pimeloyl-ACP methyl ester carboxylesterase